MKRNMSALLLGFAVIATSACIEWLDSGGVSVSNQCDSDSQCLEGFVCDADSTKQCLRRCDSSTNTCIASEHCDMLQGQSYGVCRAGTSGGDPAGGD